MTKSEARQLLPGPGDIQEWLDEMGIECKGTSDGKVDMDDCEKLIDKIVDFMGEDDENT